MEAPVALLCRRLRHVEDKFAFVLSDPYLHSLCPDVERLDRAFAHVLDHVSSSTDKKAIELVLIWLKRRHVDLRDGYLLQRTEEILRSLECDAWLQLRARITRAIVLRTMSDYDSAREELEWCISSARPTADHFAFALSSLGYADVCLFLGRHDEAEYAYVSAIATFRRYHNDVWIAHALNNMGVLKKRMCDYRASEKLLSEAHDIYNRTGLKLGLCECIKNLGIVAFRLGDLRGARKRYEVAQLGFAELQQYNQRAEFGAAMATPIPHLELVARRFDIAENLLLQSAAKYVPVEQFSVSAVINELLTELYTEKGEYSKGAHHADVAARVAGRVFPRSEWMACILRRRARLSLCQGRSLEAATIAIRCVRLSTEIDCDAERGVALVLLGQACATRKKSMWAASYFRIGVEILKRTGDCYELMRALYQYGCFLMELQKPDEAESALLEGRQLSKKLELDYYQALIAIAMADTIGPQERFDEAQSWLNEAATLRNNLEGVDRERVDEALKRAANDLQKLITAASVKSAETLKTICRVYEDARFPFEDMRADLAYQVAQSVNAEALFVIGKAGTGYRVPITYNISVNESKEIVRVLDRVLHAKTLLNVGEEPQILTTIKGQSLLAVPCREEGGNPKARKNGDRFVACARFEKNIHPGPRQIELMCASAEALARIIEEDDLRPARKLSTDAVSTDDVFDHDAEDATPRHPRGSFKSILTISPDMIKLIRTAERAATSVAPILLEGETGVGKELFARAIHGASHRKDGPFVAINAGGMPVQLLESELFGHVKGAFTDAGTDRMGLVDTARGGTLFFDEVGEMGEEMQVKLLRLLENGEYRRLGESAMRKADVRIVSATNRDLKKDSDRGQFRRDLYYRLSPLKLTIPPLRLRACDIQLMTRNFLRECAQMNGLGDRYIEIDVKAMEALELYDWPGNVRELHNEILRLVSLIGRGDMVRFPMLSDTIKDFLKSHKRIEGLLDRSVEQYERRLILDALEKNDWNKLQTADRIGIPRTTLLAKLKRMNIPLNG